MPAGPTGTCNGQPCWTAADRAQAQAEYTDSQAVRGVAEEDLAAAQSAEQQAYMRCMEANQNQCP